MSAAADTAPVACRVVGVEDVTPEVRIVRLAPEDGATFDWRAGQYANMRIGDLEPRDYSIANAPGSGEIEIHVRRTGRGGLSDHICEQVTPGAAAQLAGPFGAAYFREKHGGPLLAIAGGTGLAPMKAVAEAALESSLEYDVHLYVGVRDEREIYLERYFIDLMHRYDNFRFVMVLSEPREHSGRRTGLVGDAVAADFQILYGHQVYLAGPPPMVEACCAMLKLKSVPLHDIFTDAFYPLPVGK